MYLQRKYAEKYIQRRHLGGYDTIFESMVDRVYAIVEEKLKLEQRLAAAQMDLLMCPC